MRWQATTEGSSWSSPLRRSVRVPGVCGVHGVKHGTHAQLRENHVFGAMHFRKAAVGSIVESGQVQHAVKRVQQQLVPDGETMFFCATAGFGDADDDFTRNGATS